MERHPSERLSVIFYRVNRSFQYLMALHLRPFQITPEQWKVLKHLQEQDGLTPKMLTYMADKDKTTITRIIDSLLERGAVTKKMNLNDRRSYLIFLTDTGRALIHEVQPIPDLVNKKVCRKFSEEQMVGLKEMLDLLQTQISHETGTFSI